MGEEDVGEPGVGELGVLQGEADAVEGVVGEPAGLLAGGAGGGERVPGAGRGVGGLVLDGVEEVGEAAEEAAGLGERRRVVRPAREDGGVREGGGGRGLGRFGDGEQGVPMPARDSIPVWRSTASTRTAVSKPRARPVLAPALSQERATRRAAAATGRRANRPSRSATWSRTFAEARTSETAAASLAPSPRATGAVRMARSAQGPAVRRPASVTPV